MIRIIAGKYKNRKLKYFNIQSVRPTQARVRKSMFDTLGNIEKQTVLDLFCGIGTIGIEALSRGAKSVDFIDHNINALNVLKKNLNFLDVNNECFSISKNDVMNYLIKEKNKYDFNELNCEDRLNYSYNLVQKWLLSVIKKQTNNEYKFLNNMLLTYKRDFKKNIENFVFIVKI